MSQRSAILDRTDAASVERCTFEQFLAQAGEDVRAEWIDGEVVLMSPASDQHQDLVGFLSAILRVVAETYDLGWVRSAPFAMYLPERAQSREPDLLFVAKARMDLVRATFLEGPADLVVEVVSPDSVARDRGEKFVEYEAAGIPEYWLLDPLREQAELYRLDQRGRYKPMPQDAGVLSSEAVPGFRLRVDWLWRKPLPKVLDALRELDLLRR